MCYATLGRPVHKRCLQPVYDYVAPRREPIPSQSLTPPGAASAAFGVAAGKAGPTPIHHDDGSRTTPCAELRALGIIRLGKCILLFLAGLELGTFFRDQFFLFIIEFDLGKETNQNEMLLDDVT